MFEWLFGAFQAVIDGIVGLGRIIIDIAATVTYLIKFAGQCLAMIVQILWQLVNILLSYGQGLINTIQSVTAGTWSRGQFAGPWDAVAAVIPLAAIGWALAGIVWIMIAVAVVAALQRE